VARWRALLATFATISALVVVVLVIAAAVVAMLFLLIVVAYTAFDLGAVLPKRRP